MGEAVEVVSQVLTNHILLHEKRWMFLMPYLLFEPPASGFVGHGGGGENVLAQTS